MRWIATTRAAAALVVVAPSAHADDASRLRLAHAVVETAHAADNMRAICA